ncbi:MAG: hypothetical protein GEU80_00210 [Dehalococcoidia bacterium]|nr:hypothetical protein [Dehalococcoidia bacterium]
MPGRYQLPSTTTREWRLFASDGLLVLATLASVAGWTTVLSLGPSLLYMAWALAAAGFLAFATRGRAIAAFGISTLFLYYLGIVVLLVTAAFKIRQRLSGERR